MKDQPIDFSSIKRILVCKLRHHGDVLLTSPLFTNLKRVCPHAQIDAYIYSETQPMLEGHPAIDSFILYDKGWKTLPLWRRYANEMRLLRSIRRGGYDLVLNLTEGDRGAIAAKVSKARYRVAFDPKGQGMKGKAKLYTHLVRECPMMRHTVEMNLDLLRGIGIFPSPSHRDLTFDIPQEARSRASSLVSGDYAVVHPVSRWMFKCARDEVIADGIRALQQKGLTVVLTASKDPEEIAYNHRVRKLLDDDVIDLSGQISLKELGALIDKAALLLCVDSVPMHISSATKTPVVALFGPTSEVRWSPWQNPKFRIVKRDLPCRPCYRPGCADSHQSDCLLTIDGQEVINAISQLIS